MVQCDTVRDGLEGGCYFYKIERDTNKDECISSQKNGWSLGVPLILHSLSLMKNNLWLFLTNTFSTLRFRKHTFSLGEGYQYLNYISNLNIYVINNPDKQIKIG